MVFFLRMISGRVNDELKYNTLKSSETESNRGPR